MNAFTIDVPPTERSHETHARAIEALYATGHWLLSLGRVYDAACVFRGMAVLAPGDERPWLALGACHEALKQTQLAIEMYRTGQVLTRPAVRSRLARARALAVLGRDDDAEDARASAEEAAEAFGDAELIALVERERYTP